MNDKQKKYLSLLEDKAVEFLDSQPKEFNLLLYKVMYLRGVRVSTLEAEILTCIKQAGLD